MTIQIEHSDELMLPRRGRTPKYDLDGMEVGDFFWLDHGKVTTDITPIIAYRNRVRGWDRVYRTQTIEGRVKVQRVK